MKTLRIASILAFASLLAGAAIDAPLPVTLQLTAVVGRPLTPMSYAGVARRTTRRAVVATSAASSPYW